MIHGAVENGKIFYSSSGKGLAPFLCRNNSEVFVIDLPGRGDSIPHASEKFKHSQSQFVNRDFSKIIDTLQEKATKGLSWHGVAHSWGGVIFAAGLIRHPEYKFKSLVFFGVKRRITIKTIRKYFYVNVFWKHIGTLLTKIYGYLPAKKWKLGSDDEPTDFALQTMDWVEQENWIDHDDGFDYLLGAKTVSLPPILSLTGQADHTLGHPQDVILLMTELQQEEGEVVVLGKYNGFHEDYDHINILTHPNSVNDGYKLALDWIIRHEK
jgi:predicted alpha/beta hydrolase